MALGHSLRVRPAVFADQHLLSGLLRSSARVHRHLDWRSPLDWIGSPPFLIAERAGKTEAALACPPDPPQVAWVRLFLDLGNLPAAETWALLWQSARGMLAAKGRFVVAAIVLQDWYRDLLANSGFTSRQAIVMLERQGGAPLAPPPLAGVSIRLMMPGDLPAVAGVDAIAFAPLWQNTLPALERAYPQAALATVAEKDGSLVGYQLSTSNPYGAHLARLAVRPDAQGRGLGYALTADLIRQLRQRGIERLTVNTQSDNFASLSLYRQAGFQLTGEQYPVYELVV
jgi:ribosomal protein S18 acetylase RimI-like enzyme